MRFRAPLAPLLGVLALAASAAAPGQPAPPPIGSPPQHPRALPPRAPDPQALAAARKLLAGGGTAGHLGPYLLYTDDPDAELLGFLGRVAEGIEETYRERYGVTPLGKPAEAVVLFARHAEYQAFQNRDPLLAERAASGHSGYGLVALEDGGRLRQEVASTLVHEISHLLNRRSLGPLLPSWLDEGIADDLAQARLSESGRVLPGTLFGARAKVGNRVHIFGAQAGLARLQESIDAGVLPAIPQLLDLSWESFVGSEEGLNYIHAAFWVRYLLDGEGGALAPAFRAYLKEVGEGGPATPAVLRERLGRSWEELEAGFRKWVTGLTAEP